jgi:hypothetical protein
MWIRRFGGALLALSMLATLLHAVTAIPAVAAVGDNDTFLSLNGTSQYGESPEGSVFVARGNYSIEAWIKPSSVTCTLSPANFCTIATHDGDYTLMIADGKLQAYVYYNGTGSVVRVDSGYTLLTNEWQHVALVKNAGNVLLYINGRQVFSYTISGYTGPSTYTPGTYPFKIGHHYAGQYFSGGIDDLRIYSTNISQATIQTDMNTWGPNNASNLVAYYDFNDGNSSTISNKVAGSTSASNLTLNSAPVLSAIESVTASAQYTFVTFPRTYLTANGGWRVPTGVATADVLVVGGGGGGSGGNTNPGVCESGGGGGGGGGQVRTTLNQSISANSVLSLQVGAGGPGGAGGVAGSVFGKAGNTGSSSIFSGITSLGGGGGGTTTTNCYASPGGTSGSGTKAGGNAAVANSAGGGGGGGDSAVGNPGTSTGNSTGGAGGAGTSSSITSKVYGGGGGGSFNAYSASFAGTPGVAGAGGSGGGGSGNNASNFGSPNTGGGGGGGQGGGGGSGAHGGYGGSGVVVLRYIQNGHVNSFTFPNGVNNVSFRNSANISLNVNQRSRVTFTYSGRNILGCKNLLTTGSDNSWVATCSWKPSNRGYITIMATATPLSGAGVVTTTPLQVFVQKRTGTR